MKHKKNTKYMLDFVKRYIDGNMEQWEFDLDFDGYLIEYFPAMERENEEFSEMYNREIIGRVDYARERNISEDEARRFVAAGYSVLMGVAR